MHCVQVGAYKRVIIIFRQTMENQHAKLNYPTNKISLLDLVS